MSYYYIVVTVNGQKCFVNKDMDYTDDFDNVLRFVSKEDAEVFLRKRNLMGKDPQIIEIVDRAGEM